MAGLSLASASKAAPAEPAPEDLEFFEKRIRPLLAAHCYECHSSRAKDLRGGLRLDSRAGLAAGGDSGPVVVLGAPDKSPLFLAVRYDDQDLQMPPAGKLPSGAIADLADWVRRGAPFPPSPDAAPAPRTIDLAAGRRHWAFLPLRSPELPRLSLAAEEPAAPWREVETRVDAFILAALAERGLRPVPPAPREQLIRRLKFDLLGLPPTSEEVAEFLADDSPDAYERLVDRWLASPHYGERWARYWLDLARYCDVPESWREGEAQAWLYRDWVVRALNEDLPYNDFVRRQLAADLLPGFEPRDAAALGFLGLSPTYWKELKLDHNAIKQVVAEEWEERLDAIGGTFLGLTIACARCHDHKYDPITTQDYYALSGVLASIRLADRPIIPADLAAPAKGARDKVKELEQELAKVQKQGADAETERHAEALREEIESLRRTPHFSTPLAFGVEDASLHVLPDGPHRTRLEYRPGAPQDVAVQIRGNPARQGAVAPRRFLAVLSGSESGAYREGSGRRELAESIVGDAAPLAARVLVNRVWLHHFGRGLAATPSNFGLQGERPSHGELLEDLAARFVEGGWSLKQLHRELLLSAAYRRSSATSQEALAVDPENVYLWRMGVRRLDIEAWRDAVLAATGELALSIGGPPGELAEGKFCRRTLYGRIKRRELVDILRLNDFPDPVGHAAQRTPTTTPLQQLFVLNSPWMRERSEALAARLAREAGGDPAARIRLAHVLLFGRAATEPEIAAGSEFVAAAAKESPGEAAWRQYAHALLAANELLFVD